VLTRTLERFEGGIERFKTAFQIWGAYFTLGHTPYAYRLPADQRGVNSVTEKATTSHDTLPHTPACTHTAKGKRVLGFCRDLLTPFELLRGSLASSARVGSAFELAM